MKEILIVSGKGGTGKTSITAAIASLTQNAVLVDCDVDAADLHLILEPKIKETNDFISGHQAIIRSEDCINCLQCIENCRFDAIAETHQGVMIDSFSCEGCGVCVWSCPESAIDFNESLCGQWYVSTTRFGQMVHAKLAVAAENSGKLVSMVRSQARNIAKENNQDFILIDGPPGIGCPVIASMTGVDAVIVVTEPTLSGLHDMERVISLAKHFNIATYVCINKCDINPNIADNIKQRLKGLQVKLIGEIPYDKDITLAQINEQTITEYSSGEASKQIIKMWSNFQKEINKKEK